MHDEKLAEVLCETAEQIFFQEFEERQEAPATQDEHQEDIHWACVAVRNPSRFELVVAAAEDEIRTSMASLFPEEDELSDARISDVVAELANTIAGSLARHVDDQAGIDLSPPRKGKGQLPLAPAYHTFCANELTLKVAIRNLNSESPGPINATAHSRD